MLVPIPALTDKDRSDLQFALEQGADWIALSFVQRPEDVAEARALIGDQAALMAKIEKPAAIERLDEILELADAVMVARGDLGVELPPEGVPPMQNRIIALARQRGKPVVVATQMLESMIVSPTPTRAEVSDVATAIYDGTDAIMLSAESAAGQYPVEAVAMMDRIAISVEARPDLSGADPFHRNPGRGDHRRRSVRSRGADLPDHRGDRDGLLHQLGIDRAADRARAAVGADPGDDRIAERGAAAGAAMGGPCGPHPRRHQFRGNGRPRRGGWRCGTASPRAATGWW